MIKTIKYNFILKLFNLRYCTIPQDANQKGTHKLPSFPIRHSLGFSLVCLVLLGTIVWLMVNQYILNFSYCKI